MFSSTATDFVFWLLFFSSFELQEFVQGLSILSRGSVEEKLRWTFSLYDINGDGFITRDEMTDIVTAVYELVGRHPDAAGPDVDKIKDKVDRIFMVSKDRYGNQYAAADCQNYESIEKNRRTRFFCEILHKSVFDVQFEYTIIVLKSQSVESVSCRAFLRFFYPFSCRQMCKCRHLLPSFSFGSSHINGFSISWRFNWKHPHTHTHT